MTRAHSGRALTQITTDAAHTGDLTIDDLRISSDTLERQAQIADQHGRPELAKNFRRAAELTALDNDEILELYEALRPHRCTRDELDHRAQTLRQRGLTACAELVAEAAATYSRRNLLR